MVGGFNQGGTGDKGFMGIVQQIDMGNIGLEDVEGIPNALSSRGVAGMSR